MFRRPLLTSCIGRLSHKRWLLQKPIVYKGLFQSILLESWVEGKRGRIRSNRDNINLERTVRQNLFRKLRELHEDWIEMGVDASRATTHRKIIPCGYRRLTWAVAENNGAAASWSKSHQKKVKVAYNFQINIRVWKESESTLFDLQSDASTVWLCEVPCYLLLSVRNVSGVYVQRVFFILSSAKKV